jgi:hypothetical protein
MDVGQPFFKHLTNFYKPVDAFLTFFLVVVKHYCVWHAGFGKEGLKVLEGLGLVVISFDAIFFAKTQFVVGGLTFLFSLSLPPTMLSHHHDHLVA